MHQLSLVIMAAMSITTVSAADCYGSGWKGDPNVASEGASQVCSAHLAGLYSNSEEDSTRTACVPDGSGSWNFVFEHNFQDGEQVATLTQTACVNFLTSLVNDCDDRRYGGKESNSGWNYK